MRDTERERVRDRETESEREIYRERLVKREGHATCRCIAWNCLASSARLTCVKDTQAVLDFRPLSIRKECSAYVYCVYANRAQ